jgi:hypothetical protein
VSATTADRVSGLLSAGDTIRITGRDMSNR